MSRSWQGSAWRWGLGVGYVAVLCLVVWFLFDARHWATTELASPEALEKWSTWREDVRREQDQPAPVRRVVPKSSEPPALVLLRDYFAIMFVGAVGFSTLLYGIIAWFVMGLLREETPAE